ncbi:reverse transcriptase domain-containing protein [Undibacterium sp. TJN25]|uniref:reverse transcriptase domain-containing protein n=1 Tax=Undibacterium sp. TJN25 TaxID=3413056 RepID=UPI003BF337CE
MFPIARPLLLSIDASLNMIKQPLQTLFDAMYHGKLSFHDFLYSEMLQNYEVAHFGVENKRTIYKPKENLKMYHRFLNLFLFELLPINERAVFSYRKGTGAVNAVKKHKHGRYFFQTDIRSFFQSINSSLARSVILDGANFCAISDVSQHIDRIIELVCIDDSVPVGFPASAPLSNAVLLNFDNEVEKICKNLELEYSRYADDIIISGKDQSSLLGMDEIVQEKLHTFASQKFSINRKKTRFFQVGGKIKILGMMILPNGTISPDTKKKEELETLLHFYLSDKAKFNRMIADRTRTKKNLGNIEEAGQEILSGNLNYVDSVDPEYTNKLRRKFGAATIDILIHKGFSNKK